MLSTPTTSFTDDQYNTDSVALETEMVKAALCPGQTATPQSKANDNSRQTFRNLAGKASL